MSLEKSYLNEDEKKKAKLSEDEEKIEIKKQIEFQKTKEIISVEIETEDEVFHLKELVEKGVITKETAKKVIDGEDLEDNLIQDIFNKIEEMEELKNIDNYIPEELRITKNEYLRAVHDDIFRVRILTKLESSLTLIANTLTPESATGINIFSGFIELLDKNLIVAQENTIDVKNSLKDIDLKKGLYKDDRTLIQKIIDFLKDIFK